MQILVVLWTIVAQMLLLLARCSAFAVAGDTSTKPIPITVLSGFLGSGKTTLLKRLLENDEGLKIAVIVNDMAEVNVDGKLVASTMDPAGMVELQNGCACCSKSQELLSSVAELVTLGDVREESFDHIVIELSGVADPKSVRSNFQEAIFYDMPLMDRVRLDTMVTMIDCGTFLSHMESERATNLKDSPELYPRSASQSLENSSGDDDWSGIPSGLMQTLNPDVKTAMQNEDTSISELLVAQTETADVLLLNKVDSVDALMVSRIEATVRAMNPRARSLRTTYSAAPWKEVLGVAQGKGVVTAGLVDDHKEAVQAVTTCDDPKCNDPSHNHNHDEHSHSHNNHEKDCTDSSHDHTHAHIHGEVCTDPSHDHEHSHEHSNAINHGSIGSFVYRSRRPFHPGRLQSFLSHLPIKRGLPAKAHGSLEDIIEVDDAIQPLLNRIVRSKGFAWLADSHVAALYWSQAGVGFEMTCLGSWWATLPREFWPPEATKAILDDFDSTEHDETNEHCLTVGDRRQEVVFIGSGLNNRELQTKVCSLLDACVLNDDEWAAYVKEHKSKNNNLKRMFHNSLELKL